MKYFQENRCKLKIFSKRLTHLGFLGLVVTEPSIDFGLIYIAWLAQRFLRACIFCCACCVLCFWPHNVQRQNSQNRTAKSAARFWNNNQSLALRLVWHINRQRAANKCCRQPTSHGFLYKKATATVCALCVSCLSVRVSVSVCFSECASVCLSHTHKKGMLGTTYRTYMCFFFLLLVWPLHSCFFLRFRVSWLTK